MPELNRDQVDALIAFVDARCSQHGCDDSRRFCREWAEQAMFDWDDLVDILDDQCTFCDCEVVLNLEGRVGLKTTDAPAACETNKWRLPASFEASQSDTFSKIIVCDTSKWPKAHASHGETLIPAPKGVPPRKRVRKLVHFFVGCQSGLPSEVGVVAECPAITAGAFAKMAAASTIPELKALTFREAAYVLSKIAALPPGTPVGTSFLDITGIAGKREELRVHKVVVRR